jgi:GDPmannose 4,6-dehydratase
VSGQQDVLKLGNMDAKRDWGYAGDYVNGMWMMLQAEHPRDYVLATGETHTVREFCEQAFSYLGRPITWQGTGVDEVGVDSTGKAIIQIDPQFFRPAEVELLLGDASLIESELGWKPNVKFDKLVQMMVNSDLERIQKTSP